MALRNDDDTENDMVVDPCFINYVEKMRSLIRLFQNKNSGLVISTVQALLLWKPHNLPIKFYFLARSMFSDGYIDWDHIAALFIVAFCVTRTLRVFCAGAEDKETALKNVIEDVTSGLIRYICLHMKS